MNEEQALKEIYKRMQKLDEELRQLRMQAVGIENELEKQRVIDLILSSTHGNPEEIKKILDRDEPVCLVCGFGCCRHVYYGAEVVKSPDGNLELVGWNDEELCCENDPVHDVVLPSWYGITLKDFETS